MWLDYLNVKWAAPGEGVSGFIYYSVIPTPQVCKP